MTLLFGSAIIWADAMTECNSTTKRATLAASSAFVCFCFNWQWPPHQFLGQQFSCPLPSKNRTEVAGAQFCWSPALAGGRTLKKLRKQTPNSHFGVPMEDCTGKSVGRFEKSRHPPRNAESKGEQVQRRSTPVRNYLR